MATRTTTTTTATKSGVDSTFHKNNNKSKTTMMMQAKDNNYQEALSLCKNNNNDDSNDESSLTTCKHRILALYKFVTPKIPQSNLKGLQKELEYKCRQVHTRGTLIIAPEGINGTICYPFFDNENDNDDKLLEFLQMKFPGLRTRISVSSCAVFYRLKIKIKTEIVTIGIPSSDPTKLVGTYVSPGKDWDALLNDPDCLVVDTRNDYEYMIGTFHNAVNPNTHSFTEFPNWLKEQFEPSHENNKNPPKKVAMFCTGGIRCEKGTGECMKLLPKNVPVYHLEGGILAYLDTVPPESSQFHGECYVFDQRVAVTHGLHPTTNFVPCHACRKPLSKQDRSRSDYTPGLSCRYCVHLQTEKQRERFQSRQRQIDISTKKGEAHFHDPKELLTLQK